MADKIVKAFEALRSHYLQESTQAVALAQNSTTPEADSIGTNVKKKDASLLPRERINYCNVISDFLPMQTVKSITEFPRLLTLAMELLLVSCDDQDADVRLVAGESINKIMKAFLDSHIGRIQVELYKEIKKNGSSRSLRAAMQRFSDTSHLIRAHKRRPYVANMLPCIVKIGKRTDDSIQESLGVLMLKVIPVLGSFMNDGDVKILLKAFLPNLKSTSAVTRRTAASSLNVLCQNSRKPIHFYSWTISMLLGMITPLTEDLPSHTILGVLQSLRNIMPHLDNDQSKHGIKGSFGVMKSTSTHKDSQQQLEKKQFLQIYEVTMFCTKHKDHNVVTAALENLYQVLQCHARPLLDILLSPSGIAPTITGQLNSIAGYVTQKDSPAPSEAGDSGVTSDFQSLSSSSLSLTNDSVEGKSLNVSTLSLNSSMDEGSTDSPMFSAIPVIPSVNVLTDSGSLEVVSTDDSAKGDDVVIDEKDEHEEEDEGLHLPRTYTQGSMVNIEGDPLGVHRERLESTYLDPLDASSQTSLEELIRNESICSSDVRTIIERQFNIDAVACTGVPLVNCVRLMCSFLLSGEPGKTLPDSKTRVSVKSLALHCIGAALKMFPEALLSKVLPDECVSEESSSKQLIRDILLLTSHEDPQVRGAVSGVIGHFFYALKTVSTGKFDAWNSAMAEKYGTEALELHGLVNTIIDMLKDDSAVAIKHNCHAAKYCILSLLESGYNMFAYQLVRDMLNLRGCSYWLVKTEILDIVHQLDYRLLMILEPHWVKYKDLSNLNLKYVCIQDQVLDVMFEWLGDEDARVRQAAAIAVVKIIPNLYFVNFVESRDFACASLRYKRINDHVENVKDEFHELIAANLSAVLRKLFEIQDTSTSKFLIHGCVQCYYFLSESYPPTIHPHSWDILPTMSLKFNAPNKKATTTATTTGNSSARRLEFSSTMTSPHTTTVVSSSCGILNVTLELISAGWMMFDLQAHQDALKLCVHILCGASKPHLKSKQPDGGAGEDLTAILPDASSLVDGWTCLQDVQLITFARRTFTHITRVLNVLTHVIEQIKPVIVAKSTGTQNKEKTPLPGNVTNTSFTPSSASPMTTNTTPQPALSPSRRFTLPRSIQRKQESLDAAADHQSKTLDVSSETTMSDSNKSTPNSSSVPQSGDKSEKFGNFQHLPHYMKLYGILKGAFTNYQVSSVCSGMDKFNGFVRGILEAFSMILELATFNELGSHSDEFLEYMKAVAQIEEEFTFLAVQQLLKGLFGTNAASDPEVYVLASCTRDLIEARGDPTFSFDTSSSSSTEHDAVTMSIEHPSRKSFYDDCFMLDYKKMCASLKMVPLADSNSLERGSKAMSLLKSFKKSITTNRPSVKVSKERVASIQSYIRLFEPLVIHALKAYTTTSSTTLQCQAIHLLDQLIRLRVNYSLLDSDQVFIGFVLKQFEFINNGQISMPETFIATIFQFLVLLSYECYQPKYTQAKAIIGMPKIIRLCDEIMACEQSPLTHAIPALKPIVQDLFASQSQSRSDSSKELDAQREVVVSMLLRVVQYPQVLQMLATVLNGSKSNDEKWKRLSRLIVDTLLPSLSKLEVQIQWMDELRLLFSLLDSVAPLALRPADIILKSLFDVHLPVIDGNSSSAQVIQAVSMVIGLLRTLIMQNREDTIFSRIQQIDCSFVRKCFSMKRVSGEGDEREDFPLKSTANDENSAQYLASFVVFFVDLVVQEIGKSYDDLRTNRRSLDVLVEMLEMLFMMLVYIGKSSSYQVLSSNILKVFHEKRETQDDDKHIPLFMTINERLASFKELDTSCFLKWLFCLQSIGVTDVQFWRKNFNRISANVSSDGEGIESVAWRLGMVEKGALLLYCDIVTSQLKEVKNTDVSFVQALLTNKIADLLLHLDEPPVKELLSRILQHSELTSVFIEEVSSTVTPQFLRQQVSALKWLLHHLECVELSHSASIVRCLLNILPHIKIYGLARKAETLACRRVEYIQSLPEQKNELSLDDLNSFSQNKMFVKRYPRLCSSIQRINKNMSTEETSPRHPLDTQVNLVDYSVTKEWMFSFVKKLCFSVHDNDTSRRSTIRLLRSLNLQDIQVIMDYESFNIDLLETCISEAYSSLDIHNKYRARNNSARAELHENLKTGGSSEMENKEHVLNLAKNITINRLQTYLANTTESCVYKDFDYVVFKRSAIRELRGNREKFEGYVSILRCVIRFLIPSCYYNQSWNLKMEDGLNVTKYLLMLPLICKDDLLNHKDVFLTLELCFHSLSLLFHCQELSLCLMEQTCALMLSQTVDAIYTLVKHLVIKNGELDKSSVKKRQHEERNNDDINPFQTSCEQVSELVDALQDIVTVHRFKSDRVPAFLISHLRSTIIGLARLPFVNSYVRIPPIVWKFGWDPTPDGFYNTELPPLPVDIMKEKDVLKEFVQRVNQIGWTSRMQYEETWAALLGVLSSPPAIEGSSTEVDIELAEASCLAVHCITSLILETTLAPVPGNSAISRYSVIHRNRDYPFVSRKDGKKLVAIRIEIEKAYRDQTTCFYNPTNLFFHPVVPSLLSAKQRKQYLVNGCMMEAKLYVSNLELSDNHNNFRLGQISASAIRTRLVTSDVQEDTDSDDSDSLIIQMKERSFTSSISSDCVTPYRKLDELDIRSCLQFLLELFEQWLSPFSVPKTPLMLKMEAIKSLCILSDLLLELNHYEWILGILLDFSQTHPLEDDILMQYLIPTVCKALAVLKLEGQLAERICKLIEISIKSPHLPLQIACMAGSLYVLESYVNSTNLMLAPILTEFLTKKLQATHESALTTDSKVYMTMLWTVAFYLVENCSSEIQDPQFASLVLEIAITDVWKPMDASWPGLSNVLFRSLERLAVSQSLTRVECDRLAKVALKCISIGSSDNFIPAIGLLCTCMYNGKEVDQIVGQQANDPTMDTVISDSRLAIMERINVLLTRLRKGDVREATLLSTILPRILLDFLPSQDVMNKLISEFLSSQQLRPELIAKIFNKVAELLYKDGEENVVRDWLLLCIGSFVQRTPLSMAVWSLTCFFMSCSSNPWLKSLFPFMVERKGKFEEDDKKIFIMTALDFYTAQNLDAIQKKQFIQTFRSKVEHHPSSPYETLVACCLKSS